MDFIVRILVGRCRTLVWHSNADRVNLSSDMRAEDKLPTQLLVEFHHRFPGIGKQRTASSVEHLRTLGYLIFAISETGREIGLVLKSEV